MVTQSIVTLWQRNLGKALLSFDDQHPRITKAIDMLLTGYWYQIEVALRFASLSIEAMRSAAHP